MPAFPAWPQDDYDFNADEVGQAFAGLIQREANGTPKAGMLSAGPTLEAVTPGWKVQIGPFVYVHQEAGAVSLSGRSSDAQVDIATAAGIPAGQARIDLVCWNYDDSVLAVVEGVPATSPEAPSPGALAPVMTVRVNSGDGMVIQGQIAPAYDLTALAGRKPPVGGVVAPRSIVAQGGTEVPVTFPPGEFDAPPNVQATLLGGARDCSVYVTAVTKDGCRIGLGSSSVVARTVGAHWRAEAL